MTKEQIKLILKIEDRNPQLINIFVVLDQSSKIIKQQKEDMGKELNIRDIDVWIKLAIIYNNFQSRFPGNFNRDSTLFSYIIFIFEMYTNDKGEELYYMEIYYFKHQRKFYRFKTESGVETIDKYYE
jgi:hypothetical protein